jgi:hypothetical protein
LLAPVDRLCQEYESVGPFLDNLISDLRRILGAATAEGSERIERAAAANVTPEIDLARSRAPVEDADATTGVLLDLQEELSRLAGVKRVTLDDAGGVGTRLLVELE